MRTFDRILQNWRAKLARRWIVPGARVLDIGCHEGEFLKSLGDAIGPSTGIDPLVDPVQTARYELRRMRFERPSPFDDASFDAVVMLATLEHIIDKDSLASECYRVLKPHGRVIITVPSPFVDHIVGVLHKFGLVDGMSLEEHHGFDPRKTPEVFGRHGFALENAARFQLGLNFLFVLTKKTAAAATPVVVPASHSSPTVGV